MSHLALAACVVIVGIAGHVKEEERLCRQDTVPVKCGMKSRGPHVHQSSLGLGPD